MIYVVSSSAFMFKKIFSILRPEESSFMFYLLFKRKIHLYCILLSDFGNNSISFYSTWLTNFPSTIY